MFLSPKKRLSTHHVSPPNHHNLTTEKPCSTPAFSKTPLKNTSKNNKTPARTGAPFFSKKL
jgi:hypothetical protein